MKIKQIEWKKGKAVIEPFTPPPTTHTHHHHHHHIKNTEHELEDDYYRGGIGGGGWGGETKNQKYIQKAERLHLLFHKLRPFCPSPTNDRGRHYRICFPAWPLFSNLTPTEFRRSLLSPAYLLVHRALGLWNAAIEFTYGPHGEPFMHFYSI